MDGPMSAAPSTTTVIEARKGLLGIHFRELWAYRELAFILALRDVKVRYKQTILGIAWAVLQPALTLIVFTVVFGNLAQIPSDGVPYPLFALAALIPWQLFAYALTQASNSVVDNERLITKVYFPRLLIPLSSVLAGVLDFLIAFVLLVIMMIWFGVAPTLNILFVPFFALLAMLAALSVGLWLAALNTLYRDFRYTVPFLAQLLFFASPIAYSSSLIPESWRWLFSLNPMVGVIDGFRWALLDAPFPPWPSFLASIVGVLVLLITGSLYFRRMERTFADWI
jgi:lipopolysaccharide transport system permease protein